MPPLRVIICSAAPGEPDGCSHFLQQPEVIEKAAFRNSDLMRAIGRRTGTLVIDKVIKPDEAMQ